MPPEDDRIQAIRLKTEEVRKDVKDARPWRELAILYMELRNWALANAALKRALELDSQDPVATEKMAALKKLRFEDDLRMLRRIARDRGRGGP